MANKIWRVCIASCSSQHLSLAAHKMTLECCTSVSSTSCAIFYYYFHSFLHFTHICMHNCNYYLRKSLAIHKSSGRHTHTHTLTLSHNVIGRRAACYIFGTCVLDYTHGHWAWGMRHRRNAHRAPFPYTSYAAHIGVPFCSLAERTKCATLELLHVCYFSVCRTRGGKQSRCN